VVQLAFFLTPIFWQPSQLRPGSKVVLYNPLYHFIEIMRAPVLGHWPSAASWIIVLAIILASTVAAVVSDAYSRSRLFLWL
jgi:lipopolysaccharide transport system permease protein